VLRTAAADALVMTGEGRERLYRRGEIPPLERREAARQRKLWVHTTAIRNDPHRRSR
jgi:hypothetical protein